MITLKDLQAHIKRTPARLVAPAPPPLVPASVPVEARPTVAAILDLFGPCDITVEVEDLEQNERETVDFLKRMIYAYNVNHARILKADLFFARLDVAPEIKEKHRKEYEEIKANADTARATVWSLEGLLPFGKFFVEYDEKRFLKLFDSEFKEIKYYIKNAA
ncbi:MAG: hypothetical protein BWY90_00121 [Deltaproteobacteria bacterium ADurb.BinA014]|nr:MAG: hypothetical protein BWY90_00121 [Deltaproteobacteria bacterium ADurb.BinA014]